ncbi:DUF4440 domain-containing protein [Arachidicoccus ginsenosidimutans]|uniref:YybH family protein n=1 Tax=Arachidicoccus sp. BS20 TaxID=1850526 RepID=UPI0007F11B76|nr:nuclear transport factor 2 family protein [Arachidicoccus sp. BS20]ANI90662.1 DUF4440 domain-containing protein [Arachidicoccus sp. BS20]
MKFIITFMVVVFAATISFGQNAKQTILQTMHQQQDDWNNGDVDAFMQGYWQSDSLQFVGKQITYGWQNTLNNYKKGYPSKEAMGTLTFSDLKVDVLSKTSAFVIGAWKIVHSDKTTIGGHFTLLWKKINGKWLIVVDHTS